MSATAIPIRSFPSTQSKSSALGAMEHHARYKYVPGEEDVGTEPPAALRFEHEVARFQRAVGHQRDAARSAIVRRILKADDPDEYIQTMAQTLVSSALPGRLDDAVDILSECGPRLEQFVNGVLPQLIQSDEADEDFCYVLIRGIGKSTLPSARMFVELLWSKSPDAAVEAMGDIGGDDSLKRLRGVAAGDPSEFVRNLAAEIIEECFE